MRSASVHQEGGLDGHAEGKCRAELLAADRVLTSFSANVTVKVKAAAVFQTQQVAVPAHVPVWLRTGRSRSGK